MQTADDFAGVSAVVIAHARERFALTRCAVIALSPSSSALFAIDDADHASDAERQRYLAELSRAPVFRTAVETEAPAVTDTPAQMLLPILGPDGLVAMIHARRSSPFDAVARRELAVLASYAAIRLAQIGDPALAEVPPLSARQLEVARLVARGFANHQIAALLGITENTIKKHLKDVFQRLDLSNRTELAIRLARRYPKGH